MYTVTFACARCTRANHFSDRFCVACGLPLGAVQPDAVAGTDALEPYESPEPADPDVSRLIQEFVKRSRYDVNPSGRGWQLVVPLRLDRKQAVYAGPAGTDAEGRAIMMLVSVCAPVNDRDCRVLLKLNARSVEGHFAIRVLRGEEYFVVIENLTADSLPSVDARGLFRRVAELADGLEDRLSRGADIY
ncbi:MAG: hypothetical protein ACLQIB_30230 [Isosphaeraceae bacterium]